MLMSVVSNQPSSVQQLNIDDDPLKNQTNSVENINNEDKQEIVDKQGKDTTESQKNDTPNNVPLAGWGILFISCFGVFMASVSTSALVIAFPVVLIELEMTIGTMMWVLLVLLLVIGAVVPTAGKLGDMIGQAAIYKVGYWLFVIGSLGAGFSSSGNKGYDLVACRVIIGIGAGLLFTNSSAILTNTFALYGKVGLSQGIMQLSSALGTILGPLIGGGFADTNWRWIFWFNVPPGALCALMASFIVKDDVAPEPKSFREHMHRFDFVGAASCSAGLALLLIAMIQGVVPDPTLSTTGPLAGIIIAGVICIAVFVVDQFRAEDPLIPPSIFLNRTFVATTVCGGLMAFARNSVIYNMIFFLQGPFGMDPLSAGIALIPYGVGNVFAGFSAGALTDKIGIRSMVVLGPLLTIAGLASLAVMDNHSSNAYIGGILFLTGCGVGMFNSPNATANMLSVLPTRRGVASAIGMLTMTFSMMIGIVLTFSLVLHSMSATQLFALFIYGGNLPGLPVRALLDALALDYYIVIAACGLAAILGAVLHKKGALSAGLAASKVASTVDEEVVGGSEADVQQQILPSYEVVSIKEEV